MRADTLPAILRARALVRCDIHAGQMNIEHGTLACQTCDLRLRLEAGLLVPSTVTSRPAVTGVDRMMRSPLVAKMYERLWRPVLVRLVSRFGYSQEDVLVDRYVERHEGLQILELCSGTARAARRWVGRGANVLAVDISRPMLTDARRRCADPRLVLLQADATRPFPQSRAFDGVLCFAALHLLDAPDAALAVAANALRPRGMLIVWALTSALPAGVGRLVESLGLRPFAPGSLGLRVSGLGLEMVESVTEGAVEVVVGRSP